MQQHPIPQDITGYRFHIVGSMTLKQFGELLLAAIVAFIIFSTNLIFIIKWPLIIFVVVLGIVGAFVPIQEKPLDHWISTFIKVMYQPTKFFWKKEAKIPEVFIYQAKTTTVFQEPEINLAPAKKQRIKEYLSSVPSNKKSLKDDNVTKEKIKSIDTLFDTVTVVKKEIKKIKQHPNLDIRIRSLGKQKEFNSAELNTSSQSQNNTVEQNTILPENKVVFKKKTILNKDQVALNINVPKQDLVEVKKDQQELDEDTIRPTKIDNQSFIEDQPRNNKTIKEAIQTTFNAELPFPSKPTQINKIVGMVLSKNNDLLTDSIIEIRTQNGEVVRAVKTNALGQFFITTPLAKGKYNLITEKDNFIFKPIQININDTVIEPIEIRSEN